MSILEWSVILLSIGFLISLILNGFLLYLLYAAGRSMMYLQRMATEIGSGMTKIKATIDSEAVDDKVKIECMDECIDLITERVNRINENLK